MPPALIDVGDGTLIVPPPAAPPPQLPPAPPPPLLAPAAPPLAILTRPGVAYIDIGDVLGPAELIVAPEASPPGETLPGGDGGAGGVVGSTGDLAEAEALALANEADLSTLEPFELLDPFGLQLEGVTNPPLKGGGALSAIVQACADYGCDALAVVADALHEGASGGIGDGGTSYGPFQLHEGGALPAAFNGKGRNNPTTNGWAWSENGIRYAVHAMATASPSARGLRGHAAVYAIVYGFERPADKAGAYATRAAEYDRLAARGASWPASVAGQFRGPTGGGGVDTNPTLSPVSPTYHPAGVVKRWRDLVDVFKLDVPKAHNRVDSLAKSLKEVIR